MSEAEKTVRLTREDGYEKRWIVVGPRGAIDFHCTHAHHFLSRDFGRTGGVEFHYRRAPEWAGERAPDFDNCWVLGGRCWCDGSSMWASEYWIPMLESGGEDAIWLALEREYRSHEWPIDGSAVGTGQGGDLGTETSRG